MSDTDESPKIEGKKGGRSPRKGGKEEARGSRKGRINKRLTVLRQNLIPLFAEAGSNDINRAAELRGRHSAGVGELCRSHDHKFLGEFFGASTNVFVTTQPDTFKKPQRPGTANALGEEHSVIKCAHGIEDLKIRYAVHKGRERKGKIIANYVSCEAELCKSHVTGYRRSLQRAGNHGQASQCTPKNAFHLPGVHGRKSVGQGPRGGIVQGCSRTSQIAGAKEPRSSAPGTRFPSFSSLRRLEGGKLNSSQEPRTGGLQGD
ncbi:hypothetical protein KM043_012838 [Ampulex compressa]|nr:hypothetical protein KM043_012838 [Ampulex compressa]